MMASGKRFKWTVNTIEELMTELISRHAQFKTARRNGKMKDFYNSVGSAVATEIDGTMVDNLLRNIGREYRDVIKKQQTSGAATESEPNLRGSEELFDLYDEYHQLYFPVGGAVKPQVIVTASETFRPSGSRESQEHSFHPDSPTAHKSRTNSPAPSGKVASTHGSSKSISPAPSFPVRSTSSAIQGKRASSEGPKSSQDEASKKMKSSDFLHSSAARQEEYSDLLHKQNELLSKQNDTLDRLTREVKLIRHVLAVAHGVNVEALVESE